jgi:tetratricopeptide (TPR) repeat protein
LALVLSGCASAYRSGQIAMQEGRYLEAASRFTEVLARDPDRADALFNLGLAQYRAGLFRAAIGPFGRAVLAAPDSAEARLYLAMTYLALEDQGMAARQLRARSGRASADRRPGGPRGEPDGVGPVAS